MLEEQSALIDMGNHPRIRARGIGEVFFVEDEMHILLFEWMKLDGIIRRVIAGEVVRPIVSPAEMAEWERVVGHRLTLMN